ncbi:small integral membrane protein 33 [Mesocricetus auratus]|uniref:Small integral membrane protein 33 n=1 Tax=Mesocricetus auratus TaxID=10036 RepID=A0ABM2YIY3_MESAU|nr:small integral membrane protein 33 [Mesocricetus auratus]
MHQDARYPQPSPSVNGSLEQEPQRRLPEMLGEVWESPREDGLPLLIVIIAAFVLLALCIVLAVHCGPTLHKGHAALLTEPPALKPENGVSLIHWRLLDQPESHTQTQRGLPTPHSGSAGGGHRPSVDEVTYL